MSESQVRRTVGGKNVPVHQETVEAIVRALMAALGAGQEETEAALKGARRRWMRARAQMRSVEVPPAPVPSRIGTFEELAAGLEALRVRAGALSARTLERKAFPEQLPHSTVDRMLRYGYVPSGELVRVFAKACGVPWEELPQWQAAYDRACGEASLRQMAAQAAANRAARALREQWPATVATTASTQPAESWLQPAWTLAGMAASLSSRGTPTGRRAATVGTLDAPPQLGWSPFP